MDLLNLPNFVVENLVFVGNEIDKTFDVREGEVLEEDWTIRKRSSDEIVEERVELEWRS